MQVNTENHSATAIGVDEAFGTHYSSLQLTNRSGLLRHKQASKIYNTNEKNIRYTDNVVLGNELTTNVYGQWSLRFANNQFFFARIAAGVSQIGTRVTTLSRALHGKFATSPNKYYIINAIASKQRHKNTSFRTSH